MSESDNKPPFPKTPSGHVLSAEEMYGKDLPDSFTEDEKNHVAAEALASSGVQMNAGRILGILEAANILADHRKAMAESLKAGDYPKEHGEDIVKSIVGAIGEAYLASVQLEEHAHKVYQMFMAKHAPTQKDTAADVKLN